jgi:hypothetical protein
VLAKVCGTWKLKSIKMKKERRVKDEGNICSYTRDKRKEFGIGPHIGKWIESFSSSFNNS